MLGADCYISPVVWCVQQASYHKGLPVRKTTSVHQVVARVANVSGPWPGDADAYSFSSSGVGWLEIQTHSPTEWHYQSLATVAAVVHGLHCNATNHAQWL